jgi:hypothetical protein
MKCMSPHVRAKIVVLQAGGARQCYGVRRELGLDGAA